MLTIKHNHFTLLSFLSTTKTNFSDHDNLKHNVEMGKVDEPNLGNRIEFHDRKKLVNKDEQIPQRPKMAAT